MRPRRAVDPAGGPGARAFRRSRRVVALVAYPVATLAAALRDQPDSADRHVALDTLDHVVDGQRCDGHSGHRLHLDPGLGRRGGFGTDPEAARRTVRGDGHLQVGQWERMAERDQLAGPFAAHHTGEAGGDPDVGVVPTTPPAAWAPPVPAPSGPPPSITRLSVSSDIDTKASATARRAVTG